VRSWQDCILPVKPSTTSPSVSAKPAEAQLRTAPHPV
jgi:hypothetical protein